MSELVTRVVRAFGAERTHVADAPIGLLGAYQRFGSPFTGIATPLITRCGAKLGGGAVVCMQAGTPVRCPRCRRLASITVAGPDNTLLGAS